MAELIVADFQPQDISAVLKLARDYVARTSYRDLGMDEKVVVMNIARLPMLDQNTFKAFVAYDGDTLVSFLYCERMHPWFQPSKSMALEQFYAVTPDAPATTSDAMLNAFEAWAFSDSSTTIGIFQSLIGPRDEAIERFMTRRGYEGSEKTWILRKSAQS